MRVAKKPAAVKANSQVIRVRLGNLPRRIGSAGEVNPKGVPKLGLSGAQFKRVLGGLPGPLISTFNLALILKYIKYVNHIKTKHDLKYNILTVSIFYRYVIVNRSRQFTSTTSSNTIMRVAVVYCT